MTSGKTLVVAVSDTHINSTVALAAPSYTRQDGEEVRASKEQLILWRLWCRIAKTVAGYRHKGWRTVLLHLGDIAEFDAKGRTFRLMTHDPGEIAQLSLQTLEPMLDAVDASVWIEGTPAHSGLDGIGEVEIASQVEHCIPAPGGKVLREFTRLEISGVHFDLAHHGKMPQSPYTYQIAANRLYHELLHSYSVLRQRVPDIILRGHQHRIAEAEVDGVYTAFLPCWTFATSHTNKVNPGAVGQVGACLIWCEDGRYRKEMIWERLPEGRALPSHSI